MTRTDWRIIRKLSGDTISSWLNKVAKGYSLLFPPSVFKQSKSRSRLNKKYRAEFLKIDRCPAETKRLGSLFILRRHP